jgi:hypothetical protein
LTLFCFDGEGSGHHVGTVNKDMFYLWFKTWFKKSATQFFDLSGSSILMLS